MAPPSLERMRADFRAALPVLRAEGWSEAEIEAISPAIREAEQDAVLLVRWADWLADKAAPGWVPAVGVVPVLSDGAEARLADLAWERRSR